MAAISSGLTFNLESNKTDLTFEILLNVFEKQSLKGSLNRKEFIELFDKTISKSEPSCDGLEIQISSLLDETNEFISKLARDSFLIDKKMKSEIKDHSCVEYTEKKYFGLFGKSHLKCKFSDSSDAIEIAKETKVFDIMELFEKILITGNEKDVAQSSNENAPLIKKVKIQEHVYSRSGLKVIIPNYKCRSSEDLLTIRDTMIHLCKHWQAELDRKLPESLKKGVISREYFFKECLIKDLTNL